MSHNKYEFLYIVISSSITHAILIISLVYFVFNFIIARETNKQIVKAFLDYTHPLKEKTNTQTNDIRFNMLGKIISSYINDKYSDTIKNLNQEAIEKDKLNAKYNEKYYNRVRISLLVMSIILFAFLLFYYTGFRQYIDFGSSMTEIVLSFIVAFILIVVYQYFFAYYFVFQYIDYHFDTIITNKLDLPISKLKSKTKTIKTKITPKITLKPTPTPKITLKPTPTPTSSPTFRSTPSPTQTTTPTPTLRQ